MTAWPGRRAVVTRDLSLSADHWSMRQRFGGYTPRHVTYGEYMLGTAHRFAWAFDGDKLFLGRV